MLKIDNLHATVGGTPILNGLTLAVNAGEVHAIMGPNGAGKSTLAYVLGGRPGYAVTAGSVIFEPPLSRDSECRGQCERVRRCIIGLIHGASSSPSRASRLG